MCTLKHWFMSHLWFEKVQLPSPQVLDDRTGDNWIVKDLCSDAFYRFIHKVTAGL